MQGSKNASMVYKFVIHFHKRRYFYYFIIFDIFDIFDIVINNKCYFSDQANDYLDFYLNWISF